MIYYIGGIDRPLYRKFMNINYNYLLNKYFNDVVILDEDNINNILLKLNKSDIFIGIWRYFKKYDIILDLCRVILINIEPIPQSVLNVKRCKRSGLIECIKNIINH